MIFNLKRLLNFLIDTTIFTIVIFCFLSIFKNIIPKENALWVSLIVYFLYYFISEYFFNDTIGKIITKTRIISVQGSKVLFWQIVARTFMRLIIIDLFSYLFMKKGLHDLVSKTELIEK